MIDEIGDPNAETLEEAVAASSPAAPHDESVGHGLPLEEQPGTTIPASSYELVVVAAREARRLNDRLRRISPEKEGEKVTTRATDRVRAGQVRFAYEEDSGA